MRKIELNGKHRGVCVLVDDDMFEELNRHKWQINSSGYVSRGAVTGKTLNGRSIKKIEFMHHRVLGKKKGLQVDHINRDKLDNRKKNLRYLSVSENMRNGVGFPGRRKYSNYKGVEYYKNPGGGFGYQAKMMVEGVSINLGSFKTELEAAAAYNCLVYQLFGDGFFVNDL